MPRGTQIINGIEYVYEYRFSMTKKYIIQLSDT